LAGWTELEGALKKLDRLTQEEARMAVAENLRVTHSVRDEVKVVEGKVESVDDKVEDMGGKVEEIADNVEDIGDKVEDMGNKVEEIGCKVEGVGDKVDDIVDKVVDLNDKVQSVDEKVQVFIDGARRMSNPSLIPPNIFTSDGKQATVAAKEAKSILQQTANSVDQIKCS
jgi:methyl-accepting chemotaxis protein